MLSLGYQVGAQSLRRSSNADQSRNVGQAPVIPEVPFSGNTLTFSRTYGATEGQRIP